MTKENKVDVLPKDLSANEIQQRVALRKALTIEKTIRRNSQFPRQVHPEARAAQIMRVFDRLRSRSGGSTIPSESNNRLLRKIVDILTNKED